MRILNKVSEMPAELQMMTIPKTMTNLIIMKVIESAGKMADCSVKGSR